MTEITHKFIANSYRNFSFLSSLWQVLSASLKICELICTVGKCHMHMTTCGSSSLQMTEQSAADGCSLWTWLLVKEREAAEKLKMTKVYY